MLATLLLMRGLPLLQLIPVVASQEDSLQLFLPDARYIYLYIYVDMHAEHHKKRCFFSVIYS